MLLALGSITTIDFFLNKLHDNSISLDISLSFICIGIALLLLPIPAGRRFMRITQTFTLFAALLSMFAVIGYVYQSLSFYTIFPVTPMPLTSAFTFTILCISLLLARPNRGFTKVLTRNTPSSMLAFRFIIIVLTLPALLGYCVLQGEQFHIYDAQTGLILLVISSIILFSIAIWLNSSSLQKLELENLIIKNELEKKNVTLEVDAKTLVGKMLALEEEKQKVADKLLNREKLLDLPANSL